MSSGSIVYRARYAGFDLRYRKYEKSSDHDQNYGEESRTISKNAPHFGFPCIMDVTVVPD